MGPEAIVWEEVMNVIFYCPRSGLVWTTNQVARPVRVQFDDKGHCLSHPTREIPEYRLADDKSR